MKGEKPATNSSTINLIGNATIIGCAYAKE